ncbi:AAA-domain-containing protein [Artomyces pyxidatus]|uniref:AAA-domain-containing protein n=1 Tax=Artomyces pyxidatus TaxID=48021 RepID=A0ACB8TA73_9AGAM|nr:AAA-domain-containing protein [Artomyces pyxidatus]
MRSQILRSRTWIPSQVPSQLPSVTSRALLSYSGPAHYPRKDAASETPRPTRVYRRSSSSVTPSDANASPPSPDGEEGPSDAKPAAKNDSVGSPSNKELGPSAPQIPRDLDILWTTETLSEPLSPQSLPPSEILDEALNNLYISLHPQTQHKAAYSTPTGPPVEPTLALYCPIEGGDYIIDSSVRELARRTGSDVVVLDAVQLAAGEWGHFGKAATLLDFPQNPLHFPSYSPAPARPTSRTSDDDDEADMMSAMNYPSQMTLHVMTPTRGSSRGASISPANGSTIKAKAFFEQAVNIQPPEPPTSRSSRRPRIIYIRDFPTLSPSSASWYPALLSAVRARRQGPLARSSSPVAYPTTIVFGITPSITPPIPTPSSPSPGAQVMNLMMSRNAQTTSMPPGSKPGRSEWTEEDAAELAREKRLRDRLRKWERGDAAFLSELPKLSAGADGADEGGSSVGQSGVVVIGGSSGMSGLPSLLGPLVGRAGRSGPSDTEVNSRFFRTSVLVPVQRSATHEKASRMARRREINQLTMRMAVGAIGGLLEAKPKPTEVVTSSPAVSAPTSSTEEVTDDVVQDKPKEDVKMEKMWDEWEKRVDGWPNVTQVADQVVGQAVAASSLYHPNGAKPTLSPAIVSWSDVCRAWTAQQTSRNVRKAWMQEASNKPAKEQQEEDEEDDGEATDVDEVIENVRRDPYLTAHEHRLLGCIVDAASMPTSFSQVHLPPHTIDSIRTIVSLPILHPSAFQHGILKEHGMTGCLLFGPPGTGKTLAVRALAKEAGCRMLSITPSDVMDMYVGEGEKLVRSVFTLARRLAPCVVFIDEIDSLFGARASASETGGAIAHRGVLTEFMQEMDGLKTSREDNVIVIGATNRPFDLDDAVLRRLPRRLLVDLPGEKEREEILKILLRDEDLAPNVDLKKLAQDTPSFSGSDLKHVCVSAALDSVKEHVTVPWATTSKAQPTPITEPPPAEPVSESTPTEVTDGIQSTGETQSVEPSADDNTTSSDASTPPQPQRVLQAHNFAKALKEITPSSSETLGTLAGLRKWNEEFGEGRKQRKKQVWGKDRFGFTKEGHKIEEGRITSAPHTAAESDVSKVQ